MLRALLTVGLCACSFAWHDAHRNWPPMTERDCPSYIRAVIDTVGAAGLGFIAADAFTHRNDADSAANIFVFPFAAGALAFAASAIYGYVMPGKCERSMAHPQ